MFHKNHVIIRQLLHHDSLILTFDNNDTIYKKHLNNVQKQNNHHDVYKFFFFEILDYYIIIPRIKINSTLCFSLSFNHFTTYYKYLRFIKKKCYYLTFSIYCFLSMFTRTYWITRFLRKTNRRYNIG